MVCLCLQVCLAQTGHTAAAHPDPRQIFQQALTEQQQGDLQAAARNYEELLRLQPHLLAAEANLGTVLAGLGHFNAAIAHDRAALGLAPGNTGLLLNLGLAYYKKNDFVHASEQFHRVHEAAPGDLRVAILLGECELHLNHAAEAVALLQPFEANHAGDLDLAWVFGRALIRDGHASEGVQQVVQVARQRQSAEAWTLAARTYLGIEDFDHARSSVDNALRLNPRLPGIHTLDGRIDAFEGQDDRAAEAFRQALAATPKDAEALTDLGTVLYAKHQMEEAAADLEEALHLQPASTLARYELARVEAAQGKTAAAIQHLEEVERAKPQWLKPHIELAALYFRAKRARDGMRERRIVDRLSAGQQAHPAPPSDFSAAVPAP